MEWVGGSTAEVSARERFDWFNEVVASALAPVALATENPTAFQAEGAALALGHVQISRYSYSPVRARRTPTLIRRNDPEQYQLGLVTKGSMWLSQHRGESGTLIGDMVLWDTSRPFESGCGPTDPTVEAFVLQIPKSQLPLPADHIDRLLARKISGRTGLGAILAQFLINLGSHGPDCRPQDLDGLGTIAVELTSACLAQQLGELPDMSSASHSRTLLRQINTFIESNLADPELTPRAIADRHHISLRTLYLLFQDQPESVAASIRRRRLEHCHADLTNPRLRDQPIHTIAARWGFTQPAAFSRAFRTSYGTTPREHRSQATGH
ncbi:AraC family transcriptional regulator [Streptacidiphilus pinicola]|uniref:AraC family transcriptional regulator n=1 Tax=Streptacidiphilus pinicola TaxID=2219663 RepID=A0A2X0IGW5_9ACTN|nr:helix-turn-helix domain-containing protein [Streptacidiphilus pinicola]RAG84292.1 AraC family transcriptional regulator [Streptacidiphilus pinicola]